MHIDTDQLRHRHFVAAPLFALLLLTSMTGAVSSAGTPLRALVDAAAEDQPFFLDDGQFGVVRSGGTLIDGHLMEGSAIVSSFGLIMMDVGGVHVEGFRGSIHVSLQGTSLTVAALTTPALVRFGELALVVPAGLQGQWRPEELPASSSAMWIAEQLRALRPVPPDFITAVEQELDSLSAPLPVAESAPSLLVSLTASVLQFPAARNRNKEAATLTLAARLHAALLDGNEVEVQSIVSDPASLEQLSEASLGRSLFAELVSAFLEAQKSPFPLLLSAEDADADLILLLSLHPSARITAWTLPMSSAQEQEALRLLALLPSDIHVTPVEDFVRNRWQLVSEASLPADDPAPFLAALFHAAEPFADYAEQRQYPDRLQKNAAALVAFAEPHLAALPASLQEDVAQWRERAMLLGEEPTAKVIAASTDIGDDQEGEALQGAQPVQTEAASSSAEPLPADPQIADTLRAMLQEAGALFTTETIVDAVSGGTLEVRGILFDSAEGEHTYDFAFSVAEKQVQSIVRDGKPLPFPMEWERFIAWVRGK